MFVVIKFYYKVQTILRGFWILTKSQINAKINRIQRFYHKVFLKQLLAPKKKIQRLLDPTQDTQNDHGRRKSINTRHSAIARNSFINRRISNQIYETQALDTKELNKIYKRIIKETPQRRLFSSTALKLTLKFSWRLLVIILIDLFGNIFLFNKTYIVRSAVDFHKNFMEMTASTINMNSMASHNFAPYSNTTFINQQYIKSRGISAKNFYNFLGSLEDSTITSFFNTTDGMAKILNDIDVLQLKNYDEVGSSSKPSLFYLHDPNFNAQLIRKSLTSEDILSIQQGIAHITKLGFKTVFLTNLNLNDYLLIYYGKLPQSEASFDHIENNLNQLLMSNMNMFDHVMKVFDESLSKNRRNAYILIILFMLLFVVVFVLLMKDQLTLYHDYIPKEFFYSRNILNLFHIAEFSDNKVLEKFFIEEILPSLKQ